MHPQRLSVALAAVNATLLAALGASALRAPAATAEAADPRPIRATAIELVDAGGRVRSRLGVESDGEVVLRLFDESGRVRVKLGASDGGSGLLLLDEETEPGVQILARRVATKAGPGTTSLTLTSPAGTRRLEP
jgi:hypothetical protein